MDKSNKKLIIGIVLGILIGYVILQSFTFKECPSEHTYMHIETFSLSESEELSNAHTFFFNRQNCEEEFKKKFPNYNDFDCEISSTNGISLNMKTIELIANCDCWYNKD